LEKISKINGKIVSVTTDGFITDIENLESRLIGKKGSIIFKYKVLKYNLKFFAQTISSLFKEESFKSSLKLQANLTDFLNSYIKLTTDLKTFITEFN